MKIIAISFSTLILGMCVVSVGASKLEPIDVSFYVGRHIGATDKYDEGLMGILGNVDNVPDEVREQFNQIIDSAKAVSDEFNELQTPYDIRTIMYVEDGQFVGNYAIGTDNESEYYKEFIFDFVLTEDVDIGRGNDITLENASEEYHKQTAETISEIEEYIQKNK